MVIKFAKLLFANESQVEFSIMCNNKGHKYSMKSKIKVFKVKLFNTLFTHSTFGDRIRLCSDTAGTA